MDVGGGRGGALGLTGVVTGVLSRGLLDEEGGAGHFARLRQHGHAPASRVVMDFLLGGAKQGNE